MDIPEHLPHLVDQLGEALVRTLVDNPHCRDLALRIQASGWDLSISLEASQTPPMTEDGGIPLDFSKEDEALLRTFRIAVD